MNIKIIIKMKKKLIRIKERKKVESGIWNRRISKVKYKISS